MVVLEAVRRDSSDRRSAQPYKPGQDDIIQNWEVLHSAFAREFAAAIEDFYTGVYAPGRTQAIRMAYAQYPRGQKLYRIELEQVAQLLGNIQGEYKP